MPRLRPWLSMWIAPRRTVRALINTNPRYGVFWLSAAYMLQVIFFCLNFWSLQFKAPHYAFIFPSLLLSPALGFFWVLFYGWILCFTGRWFGGRAPAAHLRTALVWSRLPIILSLFVWVGLWIYDPSDIFIQYSPGNESLLVHGSLFFLKSWSLILFVPALSEVQGFSCLRSLANALVAWLIYMASILTILVFLRMLSYSIPLTSKILFN